MARVLRVTANLNEAISKLGVVKWQSWIIALSGKGHWRRSNCPKVVNMRQIKKTECCQKFHNILLFRQKLKKYL